MEAARDCWPTKCSSCALNTYHLLFSSIYESNCFFELSHVLALITCLLSLLHSSTILFVNHLFPISFLNLNLCSLKPFVRVLFCSLNMRTLFLYRVLKPLIHFNTSTRSPLTQHLSKECRVSSFSLSLYVRSLTLWIIFTHSSLCCF